MKDDFPALTNNKRKRTKPMSTTHPTTNEQELLQKVQQLNAREKRIVKQPFNNYIIVDFEATCKKDSATFQNEIIEFPLVLVRVDVKSQNVTIVDTLQLYIKPTRNPKLTPFCVELTGITQDQVDNGVLLRDALKQVHEWLVKHDLISGEYDEWTFGKQDYNKDQMTRTLTGIKFAFATDGPWDMRDFLEKECLTKKIEKPIYYSQWIDVRDAFASFYQTKKKNILKMLSHHQMSFEGREHSGLDDSINIARIFMRMLEDGCHLQINDSIYNHIASIKRREKQSKQSGKPVTQPFEVAVILDVTSTHNAPLSSNKPSSLYLVEDQIIEIGAVAFSTKTLEQVGSPFHVLVKPSFQKTLDHTAVPQREELEDLFCTYISDGVTFTEAFNQLRDWLVDNSLMKPGRNKKQPVDPSKKPVPRPSCGIVVYSADGMKLLRQNMASVNMSPPPLFRSFVTILDTWRAYVSNHGISPQSDMFSTLNIEKHIKEMAVSAKSASIHMAQHTATYKDLLKTLLQQGQLFSLTSS